MKGFVLLLEILLGAASILVLLPASVFFLEIGLGLSRRRHSPEQRGDRRRITVLVPAHNEATLISRTIRSIAPQLNANDQLLVIADNCTDETANVASREGAEVLVRADLGRRGKGYALDYGVRHLEKNAPAPDIVIIVDADCLVAPDTIDRIARLCAGTNRPVQALYLMRTQAGARLRMRIAEFAWLVKNRTRPDGLSRLALPCQLAGTGMAFPWPAISTANLATGHIVEDMKLGVDLARAGFPPLFCPDALVTSEFPTSDSGAQGQRTRWEHGHLTVILQEAPRLFLDSIRQRNLKLLAMALDLSVPPLALLALQIAILWIGGFLTLLTLDMWVPFLISSFAAALILGATLLAWTRFGRTIISLRELGFAVVYTLWKLPLYLKFLWARQLDWVRSKRDGEQP